MRAVIYGIELRARRLRQFAQARVHAAHVFLRHHAARHARLVADDYQEKARLFERAQDELNDGIRPELTDLPEADVIAQYDTILLGFPIWWYDLPMPVWTFLEAYDFSGKTIIPYFTHNGSTGGASSLDTIEKLCPNSTVRSDDALSLWGDRVEGSEETVKEWLDGLGLTK